MTYHNTCLSLAVLWLSIACFSASSLAQSSVPVSTTAATTTAATATAQPLSVPPQPLGFMGTLSVPISKCHSCWKNCTVRKLLKNGMAPLSAATGGLIGGGHENPPPPIAAVALPPPPPPAVNAAAVIKVEAAQAEARVEAVRYLATVDCHWYPEAEAGLIASLRADRSECVRLAAAEALGRGCCCSKKTIAALQLAAAGSNLDGNPGERCPRVRWAALEALQTCLLQCNAADFQQPAFEERPESPGQPLAGTGAGATLSRYYTQIESVSAERLLLDAHRTCARLAQQPSATAAAPVQAPRSLYGIWAATNAASPTAGAERLPSEATAAGVEEFYTTVPADVQQVDGSTQPYRTHLPLGTGGIQPVNAAFPMSGNQ